MKSKKLICMAVAAALTLGVTVTSGCIAINNEENVKQVVATVDITKNENFVKQYEDYASAVTEEVFIKRDLLTSYINGGYQLAQQYDNATIFNAIKNSLVENAVYSQYATVALLKDKVAKNELSLETFKSKTTQKDKYEYLLGGEQSEGVKKAKYELYSTLNSLLDGAEEDELDKKDGYTGSGTRSTPGGIDSLKEDHIPENYGVYTGYQGYLLSDAGEYEPLDGTSRNTRRKAYAEFIGSLKRNYVLTAEDTETTDVLKLSYVQDSYVSQLQQEVINAFNDMYEEQQEALITKVEDGVYTYVKNKYDGDDGELITQEKSYSTAAAFESAMGSMSDTKFILYSPATDDTAEQDGTRGTFGYVYNILLPFSTTQNKKLTALQDYRNSDVIDESGYFAERNQLLKQITTTDQREAWFNGETDYSFNAAEYNEDKTDKLAYYDGGSADRKYLFFENNLTKPDKYEPLEKYTGLYSYNGKVTKNTDGSYRLIPKKLNIDDMLSEFAAYINYVLGTDSVQTYAGDMFGGTAYSGENSAYYGEKSFTVEGDDTQIDYSKLVYATGMVNLTASKEDAFVTTSDRYKAMSAVNELQYAYTTDTGVLSQYIGYSVSAYETSYIKEFEYAAQQALRMGVGSFKVCAGDYGWHLIYVTDAFTFEGGKGGEVYSPVWSKERVETEGTFENRFYEWLKDSTLTNEASKKRAEVLKDFNTEEAVKVYEKAYKDLTT
ncbi:MAG: hypothetical protein K2N17_03300 [Clostridia bacterium]|nr:hypothetical protein [Clostridia bacterium]